MCHLFQGICRHLNCQQSKYCNSFTEKKGKGRRKRRSETGMEISTGLVLLACVLLVSRETGSQIGEGEMVERGKMEEGRKPIL